MGLPNGIHSQVRRLVSSDRTLTYHEVEDVRGAMLIVTQIPDSDPERWLQLDLSPTEASIHGEREGHQG